ncbi:MAG: tetratricopeptide repeat protein [Qipengyuania sp.]
MAARPVSEAPRDFHARAMAAERAGDRAGAGSIMEEGLAAQPHDAALRNSAGSLAMRSDEAARAEELFRSAIELEPANLEFAINLAIALDRQSRHGEAADLLVQRERAGAGVPRYWSVRGAAERAARRLAAAQTSYDRCLSLEPGHKRALHGRARVAIERGEADAHARFERALTANPGEPDLWLGKAQALDVEGDAAGARRIMEQVVAQAPGYLEGLKFLAQLRLAAGEEDFAAPYAEAAQKLPADPRIPMAHTEILAGLDHAARAAQVAAEAAERFPGEPLFRFLEAVHAGSAGEDDRAETIFASLELDTPERHLHEARHRIRRGEAERAEALLDAVSEVRPWSIEAWALRGIAWRLAGDWRAQWLHGQEGLVQRLPLRGAADLPLRATAHLRVLHANSPLPLGQSLRGGTQTRGILFDRPDPVLAELREAILLTIEDYREHLPPYDEAHPLLRYRKDDMQLAGSWSVRLTGGGDHHTAHIHPQGIVSSALYLVVPPDSAGEQQRGWLEVGRPPPDLRLDLPPLETIRPEPGFLALFPSTLYHGTTPFGEAERVTVAFDAVPRQESRHER